MVVARTALFLVRWTKYYFAVSIHFWRGLTCLFAHKCSRYTVLLLSIDRYPGRFPLGNPYWHTLLPFRNPGHGTRNVDVTVCGKGPVTHLFQDVYCGHSAEVSTGE